METQEPSIQGAVTNFCHKVSFVSIFSFPLLIVFYVVYRLGPIEIEIMDNISLALTYAWLVLISLYLGRIPRLAWNNQHSNLNTKIVYYSLFPIFSTLILIISFIEIFSSYGLIEVGSDWSELITHYLAVFLVAEIILDFISLIKHGKDSSTNFDSDLGPNPTAITTSISQRHQDKFFTYNRTCWLIFVSGIGAIYIGLTNPTYLAITGVVLSLEHILAAITD